MSYGQLTKDCHLWLRMSVLTLLLLSCGGCLYGGGYVGYNTYEPYPVAPVAVFGGYYQQRNDVRREDDRGRQSVRFYQQHQADHHYNHNDEHRR